MRGVKEEGNSNTKSKAKKKRTVFDSVATDTMRPTVTAEGDSVACV